MSDKDNKGGKAKELPPPKTPPPPPPPPKPKETIYKV